MGGGFNIIIDYISIILIILTIWLSQLIILANKFILNRNYFQLVVKGLIGFLILRFSTSRLFLFYIYFERSLIIIFLIIIGWGYQPERLPAGLALFFYTLFASLPLLLVIFFFNKRVYLINFINIRNRIKLYLNWSFLLKFFIRIAFIVKLPVFFVHLWLPKAHVEAPVRGSIILAGVLLKLGGYGFLRIIRLIEKSLRLIFYRVWAIVGGTLLRVICLRHRDIKVLIAYSSVVHIAIVLIGVTRITIWGFRGIIITIIAHGVCSSGIFAWANLIYERRHSRRLLINKGFLNTFPRLAIWWFLLVVGNFGGPFTLNLIGEILLISTRFILNIRFVLCICGLAFFSAAYRLLLYASRQQGTQLISTFPLNNLTLREHQLLYAHIWPIRVLILSPIFF